MEVHETSNDNKGGQQEPLFFYAFFKHVVYNGGDPLHIKYKCKKLCHF